MKIELGKEYRTRDGREVRIYAVDGGGARSIHGAVLCIDGWGARTWEPNGRLYLGQEDEFDIVPAPVTREMWANVWSDGMAGNMRGTLFGSKYEADTSGLSDRRIACVPVTITYHEGEGLE